ncbi:MAG: MinD/ParA family protein [Acidobacteria bacterium]|nr:MinD/ParA family protein [Acidobacteriota bacterium]
MKVDAAGPKVLAVTSGKGGVGKTNVVANLAFSLSELGSKVVVLDADFGLANIDVLLGLTPRFHLGHVLFGNKSLAEIMVQGPKGIRIIPASSGLQRMSELTPAQRNHLVECFSNLDGDADYFLIDTAAGISRNVIHFLLSAQEVIVVSAPEPTAIVDAYAVIKIILAADHKKKIQVLINSVESADDAHEVYCQINSVVKRFLRREVDYLGHVQRDSCVTQAVRSQTLVTQRYPDASSSRCFRSLARRLGMQGRGDPFGGGLVWKKLLNDWIN